MEAGEKISNQRNKSLLYSSFSVLLAAVQDASLAVDFNNAPFIFTLHSHSCYKGKFIPSQSFDSSLGTERRNIYRSQRRNELQKIVIAIHTCIMEPRAKRQLYY